MKRQLLVTLVAVGLMANAAFAETPEAQFKVEKRAMTPVAAKIIAVPAVMKCMPGYTKTGSHLNSNGGIDRMECQSPVFECPDKSTVKNKKGAAASGQGIKVEEVPVGNVGDSNKFRIKYTCTYIWPQG